jgi:glycerol-3-phosphate dehydrogenase (NAD(P)+)
MSEKHNIWIIWAWAWGIALAFVLNKNWHNVTLWEYNKTLYNKILKERQVPTKLPWFFIPKKINFTNNINDIVKNNIILNAIPTQVIRTSIKTIKETNWENKILINASKWIEMNTGKSIMKIYLEETKLNKDNYIALSWPSFAYEVCSNPMPTNVSLAWYNQKKLEHVANLFNNDLFSVSTNNDPIWTELCWSLKNIYAIWSWIINWFWYGINTKSIIITKWLKEISEFANFIWVKKETIYNLCGVGDLILTCSSKLSRNYSVWKKIWNWEKLEDMVWSSTIEWVFTSKIVYRILEENKLNMPIAKCIYQILYENLDPKTIIKATLQN